MNRGFGFAAVLIFSIWAFVDGGAIYERQLSAKGPGLRDPQCKSYCDPSECIVSEDGKYFKCDANKGDPCKSKPCMNGAKCILDDEKGYLCVCMKPFFGRLCEKGGQH